ncbi:hypothetical protein MTO96_004540 [Rhipicephalus appendiculatus]
MGDMLQHYEECRFHSVESSRCGEAVPLRESTTHFVAGCSVGVSSATTDQMSSELQNVRNAVEEVETMLTHSNHDQVMSAIQSQVNELAEQVRNRESSFASKSSSGLKAALVTWRES